MGVWRRTKLGSVFIPDATAAVPQSRARVEKTSSDDLSNLEKLLHEIESEALSEVVPLDQILAKVAFAHRNFRYRSIVFRPGRKVYRAVKEDRPLLTIADLGYPPAVYATPGRANTRGQSVFYGAVTNPVACLYECRAKAGEVFAVTQYLTTAAMHLLPWGYPEEVCQNLSTLGDAPLPWMGSQFDCPTYRLLRSWQRAIYSKAIKTGQENQYRVSALLAAYAEQRPAGPNGERYAGIIYPSVAINGYSDNVALFPRFVDSALRFSYSNKLLIKRITPANEVEGPSFVADLMPFALADQTDSKGQLIWYSRSTHEAFSRTDFSPNFNRSAGSGQDKFRPRK